MSVDANIETISGIAGAVVELLSHGNADIRRYAAEVSLNANTETAAAAGALVAETQTSRRPSQFRGGTTGSTT